MDLDQLALDPTSKIWTPSAPTKVEKLPFPNHYFWVVGDNGKAIKMTSTEDGRMIPVDPYGL